MTTLRLSPNLPPRAGFTLLEILIAMGLSAIVLSAGVALFANSNRVFNSSIQTGLTQQTTRSALDMMANEIILAGFGTIDPNLAASAATPEDEYAFPVGTINSNIGPDALQFKACLGGMAIVVEETPVNALVGGNPGNNGVQIHAGQGHDLLRSGSIVDILDLTRRRLIGGTLGDVGAPGFPTDRLVFASTDANRKEPSEQNVQTVPVGALIIDRPVYVTYRLNGTNLLRCVRTAQADACDEDAGLLNRIPTAGDPSTTFVLARSVADLQFSYQFGTETEFLPTPARQTALDAINRNSIRAIKIEVLMRSEARDPMVTEKDCNAGSVPQVYYVGDRTFDASRDNCGYTYMLLHTVVRVPNMAMAGL